MTRLLMISNQSRPEGHAGFRAAFEEMVRAGDLTAFEYVAPLTVPPGGSPLSLSELRDLVSGFAPQVLLVASPSGLGHTADFVAALLAAGASPKVLYYEGDAWGAFAKPVNRSMAAWLSNADIVFYVVHPSDASHLRRHGARDIRFVPHTYCQETFAEWESAPPTATPESDAVLIGSRLARWGLVSRLPGAVQRARLVRRLQRRDDIRLALYGDGWSGRGALGPLPYPAQVEAIRKGIVSINWDHFPSYRSYASDRLPISMLAGRVHITTSHPGYDWLPGEDTGVFTAPTIPTLLAKLDSVLARPLEEVLALGETAHEWVRRRLSHREAAAYMLGSLQPRLLTDVPEDPWHRLGRGALDGR